MRLLHYLSQDKQAALEGGDSRAHQDAGGFTMLQQDDVGGLEIKTKSGEWLIVPPVENSFVVNIGDSMRLWTNNRFASTLHRVVNHYGRERYSVGVFANPDYDTVIRPLPTCVDAEHPPTFDKMLSGEALLFLYSRVWPSQGRAGQGVGVLEVTSLPIAESAAFPPQRRGSEPVDRTPECP